MVEHIFWRERTFYGIVSQSIHALEKSTPEKEIVTTREGPFKTEWRGTPGKGKAVKSSNPGGAFSDSTYVHLVGVHHYSRHFN